MSDNNSPWDQLCKDVIDQQVSLAGQAVRGLELSGEPLRADVAFFWPEGGLEGRKLVGLGLLGRMLEDGACVFEPHSANPDEDDVRSAARKAQYLRKLCKDHGKAGPGRIWLLSPGRPTTLLERFGCDAASLSWPDGVYFSAEGVGLAVVVISELPEVRSTLTLRLMGRRRILKKAWRELQALPDDAPERQLLPLFMRYARPLLEASDQGQLVLDEDEQEVWMDAQRWLEQRERQSEEAGRRAELRELFELRLGRPLTEPEQASFDARLEADGHQHLARAVLEHDAAGLTAWLAEHDG